MQSEHVDILVVGAGLSGIGAGYHIQDKCPDKSYAILEGRDAIGGTWDLFRYPGVRSDSDMFTLGYSFHPWTSDKVITSGESILNYIRLTAEKFGIEDHIHFQKGCWSGTNTGESCRPCMSKFNINGRTAIITGAASGIGQAISVSLAQRGCHVIITDINELGLQDTAQMCQPHGVKIQCHRLDVSNPQVIRDFAEQIRTEEQSVDVLVNNAGVALGGDFNQVTQDDFEWLLDINLHGVIRMTRAFMPLLEASDDACIVNISSIFGIIAPPGQTAYSTAKFGVRGFSEALRHELMQSGSKVRVTQVHPGGINTNIVKNSRIAEQVKIDVPDFEQEMRDFEKTLVMPPSQAGEIIVKGMVNRKKRVLVGNDAHIISMITRFLPVNYFSILRSFF